MNESKRKLFSWRSVPVIKDLLQAWRDFCKERTLPCYHLASNTAAHPELLLYPIDMSPLLSLPFGTLDKDGVLYNDLHGTVPAGYHPTSIAQFALAHWNTYLANGSHAHREAFILQARWLLDNETRFSDYASGWPLPFAWQSFHASGPWLSALTQGNVISVLVRAYQLTGKSEFLETARRAVRLFELDILDGGVSASVSQKGKFFEEVAVYPAAHVLNGYILALFGLYDYVSLTQDRGIEALIHHSLATFHEIISEFDAGYWSRYDLMHKTLAPLFYHALHIVLLEALSDYSGCEHCRELAARWKQYQHRFTCRLRYLIASRTRLYWSRRLMPRLRRAVFGVSHNSSQGAFEHICVPITAFPVAGGVRGVLAGVERTMSNRWNMVYLTRHEGRNVQGLEIQVFGGKWTSPWYFPSIWLYCLAGCCKLFALLRHKPYTLILPQDGVFSGAFAAVLGKIAGVRVVCMDHGNVAWLAHPSIRKEWVKALKSLSWHRRFFSRLGYVCYWPSFSLLAKVAARCTDQFLIAGDEVEDAYRKSLGVPPSRIVRYNYALDVTRFTPPDNATRSKMRAGKNIDEDAILIVLINRLTSEKGLSFAIEGVARALSVLPAHVRIRVKVLIAGEGPLHSQIQADIRRRGLASVCIMQGEAAPQDVITLLAISNIFLYSGTRGTNYSMAVLEAMSAGCAVIASVAPQSNAALLADGRGIPIEPGSAAAISEALVRLCSDLALCRQMGQMARDYVADHHNVEALKRSLLRASYFTPILVEENVKSMVPVGRVQHLA